MPKSSHNASCKDMEVCAATQYDGCPDHQTSAIGMVDISEIEGLSKMNGAVFLNLKIRNLDSIDQMETLSKC
ncbi:hypothetical protein TNCV_1925421 [Trichonephila clavipes]|nr:hypothetical protein TNCV_1925421 [Trichonephila clavipes]